LVSKFTPTGIEGACVSTVTGGCVGSGVGGTVGATDRSVGDIRGVGAMVGVGGCVGRGDGVALGTSVAVADGVNVGVASGSERPGSVQASIDSARSPARTTVQVWA